MAVPFSVSARKNPLKPDESPRYYATAQASGEITFKEICARIADRCTVTASDAKATLDALVTIMKEALGNGQIVRFNDLGSFRMTLKTGRPTDKAEDFLSNVNVDGAKIIFRPEMDLKRHTKTFTYQKVSSLPKKEKKEEVKG